MKRWFAWILVGLMINEMLVFASISLAQKEKWTKKVDMPMPRTALATAVVNEKIYVIGGSNNGSLSTVEEYDPLTDTWTKKADMPTARYLMDANAVNGKIYVIGGGRFIPPVLTVLSAVEEYNPLTDTWIKKADLPEPRHSFSSAVVNGKIYVIGGQWQPGSIFPTVFEYDPIADTWTRKADIPTQRAFLATAVVNGKIYAIGGYGGVAKPYSVLSMVEEYDPATNTWSRKSKMRTARMNLALTVVNGKTFVFGGIENLVARVSLSTVEEYDVATNTWTRKSDMPTARCCLSTSAVKGKIYAIGGSDSRGNPLSVVEEYTPEGWPFSVSLQGKIPTLWGKIKVKD